MTPLQPHETSAATIVLPLPRLAGGAGTRKAATGARADDSESLPLDQMSTLLWTGTAFRQHRHGRAALPQRMRPLVAVYAVLRDGTYRYDPAEHSLVLVTSRHLGRWIDPHGGTRSALDLLYVDDGAPEEEGEWEECGTVAAAGAAQIAENIAAYCTCVGLVARVARRVAPQLMSELGLAPPHRIALVQRVGYPAGSPH